MSNKGVESTIQQLNYHNRSVKWVLELGELIGIESIQHIESKNDYGGDICHMLYFYLLLNSFA